MPNVFKYSPGGSGPGTLKKGDFLIGNNTADYGGTYYNGISPASGGYSIYLNKASQGPSIYTPANDAELLDLTNNQIAGGTWAPAGYTGAEQCLAYFASQADKVCVNIDYPEISTNGLSVALDAGFTPSYPRGGTTWYSVGPGGGNAVLTNGPTYTSSNGGGIVFDGVDDYAIISNASDLINTTTSGTVDFFYKLNSIPGSNYRDVWGIRNSSSGRIFWYENNEITNPSPIMRLVWRNSDDSLESISSGIPYDSLLVYNITFTYVVSGGSTTIVLYKNGSLVQSSTVNKVLASPSNEIRLGTDSTQYSNCTIFTYRIYNRVLSAAEILQNFNAQKSRFGL